MPEEIFVTLLFGFGTGWFLKTALIWRRDAKKALPAETRVVTVAPAVAATPAQEARIERLMEKLGQRLEALEDRIDFTERLLDSRNRARLDPSEARHGLTITPGESGDLPRR
jgi:hypothetical protein